MNSQTSLDKFGNFLVENLRDSGIDFFDKLLANGWRAPDLEIIQSRLQEISSEQKAILRTAVTNTIDVAIHDFLFALQSNDQSDIKILVDGKDVVELSDGIHGESYSSDGWNARFSRFNAS